MKTSITESLLDTVIRIWRDLPKPDPLKVQVQLSYEFGDERAKEISECSFLSLASSFTSDSTYQLLANLDEDDLLYYTGSLILVLLDGLGRTTGVPPYFKEVSTDDMVNVAGSSLASLFGSSNFRSLLPTMEIRARRICWITAVLLDVRSNDAVPLHWKTRKKMMESFEPFLDEILL